MMNWKSDLPNRAAAGVSRPDQGADAYFPPPAYGYGGMAANDPRTSSSQSLAPSLPEYEEVARRTLLVVYIHGFMGNDTSFQSFPAHVHRFLRDALAETHVIHSKIYPRYKTYKALEVARDNFSRWLEPHESANTDVVLVGHSMGGLLAAEVALMPTWNSRDPRFFQHRILGTVHLDAPLLGLHPGIVVSGISSLFRPKPDGPTPQEGPAGSSQAAAGTASPEAASLYSDPSSPGGAPGPSPPALPHTVTLDPNFNPEFPNDVRLQERSWWKNVVHFVKKHNSEGLVDAATSHIMSHLEFGSVLMEFNCLKVRYENLRKLEDVDDVKNHGVPQVPPQVRFIQYYTVCHGFPKKPKTPSQEKPTDASESSTAVHGDGNSRLSLSAGSTGGEQKGGQRSSALLDVPNKDSLTSDGSDGSRSASSLELVDPEPIQDEDDGPGGAVKEPKGPPPLPPRQISQAAEPATAEGQDGAEKKESVETDVEQKSDLRPRTSLDGGPTQEEADAFEANLPAIPELPEKPAPFEPEKFTDKDSRKQAEKEAKRAQKAYEQAVKNREKSLKERQKIVDKRKKKAASEAEKREKEEQKRQKAEQKAEKKAEQEKEKGKKSEEDGVRLEAGAVESAVEAQKSLADAGAAAAPTPPPPEPSRAPPSPEPSPAPMDPTAVMPSSSSEEANKKKLEKPEKPPKPPKERKFINLPSKVNGQVDPKWVKIFMKDTDEVGAHTGLFFPGPHYETLVGDVGDMILSWVHEDATKKTILGLP